MEKEILFTDSEHLGGQHKTFTEGCYECAKESRLISAKRVVNRNWDNLYPQGRNEQALSRLDFNIDKNPLG